MAVEVLPVVVVVVVGEELVTLRTMRGKICLLFPDTIAATATAKTSIMDINRQLKLAAVVGYRD